MSVSTYFNIQDTLIRPLKKSSMYVVLQCMVAFVIVAPLFFGGVVYKIMTDFFELNSFIALVAAATTAIVLFITDRYFVVQRVTSQDPSTLSRPFLFFRIMTTILLVFMGVASLTTFLSPDIEGEKITQVNQRFEELIKNDSEINRLTNDLEEARENRKIYLNYVEKRQQSELQINLARKKMLNEEAGATDEDGNTTNAGKGKRYDGAKNKLEEDEANLAVLNRNIDELSYDKNAVQHITQKIDSRELQLREKAEKEFAGSLNKVGGLWQILKNDGTNRFTAILIFGFIVFVDMIYMSVLMALPVNSTLQLLFQNEKDYTNGLQIIERHARRQEISNQIPTRIIEAPNDTQTNSPVVNNNEPALNEQAKAETPAIDANINDAPDNRSG